MRKNETESDLLTAVPELATLRVGNGALKSKELPRRLKIAAWGENQSTHGPYLVGERTVQLLEANQHKLGFDRVAIDFDHASVPGSNAFVKGQVPPIFGYGAPKVYPKDGLYLEDVTWTPLAELHARNFEDMSPAVYPKEAGQEITFVHSLALTTNGSVYDLMFHSANQPSGAAGTKDEEPSMNEQNVLLVSDLAPVVGLAATAAKADVLGKLVLLSALAAAVTVQDGKVVKLDVQPLSALDARLKTLEGATPSGGASAAELATLSGKVTSLESLLNQQTGAVTEKERSELVLLFAKEGKVPIGLDGKALPEAELKKLDVGTLRILHANTPATVPLHQRGKVADAASNNNGLTGAARAGAAWGHLSKE